jgi:hypothetical protein
LRLSLLHLFQPSVDCNGMGTFGSGDEDRDDRVGEDETGEEPGELYQCCFWIGIEVGGLRIGMYWPLLSAIV